VKGLSENIRVSSTIGRFLEHSRIFWFGDGKADPLDGDFFIGSADWMYRNLNTRVECAAPIEARRHRERLWEILQYHLTDRRQRWLMKPDGSYAPSDPVAVPAGAAAGDPEYMGTHQRLMQATQELQARTRAARLREG
jgi:polyphosphate kinase